MDIQGIRAGLNVRRFHTQPTLETDTVGKHSAGVALFCLLIDPGCRKEVLTHALTHDLGEYVTGDIPSPAKRAMTDDARMALEILEEEVIDSMGIDRPELNPDEYRLLKVADMLDGLAFCAEELRRGNSAIEPAGQNFLKYLMEFLGNSKDQPWYATAFTVFYIVNRSFLDAIRK